MTIVLVAANTNNLVKPWRVRYTNQGFILVGCMSRSSIFVFSATAALLHLADHAMSDDGYAPCVG
jgi:hypothetical protein